MSILINARPIDLTKFDRGEATPLGVAIKYGEQFPDFNKSKTHQLAERIQEQLGLSGIDTLIDPKTTLSIPPKTFVQLFGKAENPQQKSIGEDLGKHVKQPTKAQDNRFEVAEMTLDLGMETDLLDDGPIGGLSIAIKSGDAQETDKALNRVLSTLADTPPGPKRQALATKLTDLVFFSPAPWPTEAYQKDGLADRFAKAYVVAAEHLRTGLGDEQRGVPLSQEDVALLRKVESSSDFPPAGRARAVAALASGQALNASRLDGQKKTVAKTEELIEQYLNEPSAMGAKNRMTPSMLITIDKLIDDGNVVRIAKDEVKTFPPDKLPLQNYHLERRLGGGAFGAAYLATHASSDGSVQSVVIKKVPLQLDKRTRQEALDTALNEIALHGRVQQFDDGAHVCKVMKAFVTRDDVFVVLEKGERSLQSYLDSGAIKTTRQVVQVLADLTEATVTAHKHGVTHHDIKPDNLLKKTNEERWMLADFGISRSTATSSNKEDAQLVSRMAVNILRGLPREALSKEATAMLAKVGDSFGSPSMTDLAKLDLTMADPSDLGLMVLKQAQSLRLAENVPITQRLETMQTTLAKLLENSTV